MLVSVLLQVDTAADDETTFADAVRTVRALGQTRMLAWTHKYQGVRLPVTPRTTPEDLALALRAALSFAAKQPSA